MRYVMVPVPSEYVLDVMRWVLFRAADEDASALKQDEDRVLGLIRDADEFTRSLLAVVAAATVKDRPLRLRDLADELGRDGQAVIRAIRTLNQTVLEEGRDLLEVRSEKAVGVHGKTGTTLYVSMRPAVAPIVRAATRADGEH